MSDLSSGVAVALLYETREHAEHLREALAALAAPIVYEAAAHAFDRAALARSAANVVVVNLDAGDEPGLDAVYDLLDDARYRVVFNEGEVSRGLAGWDQARWARHLATKIFGDGDLDPPRPADAEPVPARAPAPPADVPPVDEPSHIAALAAPPELPPVPEAATAFALADLDALFDAPPVVAQSDDAGAAPATGMAPARAEPVATLLDELGVEPPARAPAAAFDAFDLGELDALIDAPAVAHASADLAPALAFDDLDAPAFDLDAAAAAAAAVPAAPADDLPPGADLDLDAGLDLSLDLEPGARAPAAPAWSLEDVIEADADDAAMADAAAAFGIEKVDPAEYLASAGGDATTHASIMAPAWSLEDALDEAEGERAAASAAPFGIEKLSSAEYLAPDAGAVAPELPPVSGLSLELIPLEEAVAPSTQAVVHETWLDPDAAKVRRVWVLGASIGGPESVREFLAAFPRDYPALFVLAQHLGDEFVGMMTQQLAKATALTVRTPTHGERVGHGEVVVVPNAKRLLVDAQGVVVLEPIRGESAFSPSIDRVLQDMADRFGAAAGAIVFSGMTHDAIEGCRYLAAKGGTVYAQRPDTCVVSSMVEGVCEAGVVSFLGSPRELADKLLGARP
ncbi:MAG: chemotaxis protein CheB [Rhodanobacteraceae bacterium]|nr:chemotaxis protein CheB [Rhodanobacteraceae bacterium]